MVNLWAVIVSVKLALPQQIEICRFLCIAHITENPGVGIADGIRFGQPPIVITVIEDPGKSQLAQV